MAWRLEVRNRLTVVNEALLTGARLAAVRAATRLVREMRVRGVTADQVLDVIQEENPSFGIELRRLFTRLRPLLDEA